MTLSFEIIARSGQARRGRLHTNHGVVETPVFMPVGTLGSVKSLDPRDLHHLDARICLANAYHLMLRPGAEEVAALGGLHRFSGYDGALLTDSGGFQVYSLADLREVTDAGIVFRSHIDGSLHTLTPERLVAVQEFLAPDIAMVIDECPPAGADLRTVTAAVTRTTQWAERCLQARKRNDIAWFGIAQGALHEGLRTDHAGTIGALPFDGVAIGGVSVGESTEDIRRIVAHTAPLLPDAKPRYLMGVGTPADIVHGVSCGVDIFDCVLPTRNARNGYFFTRNGKVVIRNAAHRQSQEPIDAGCPCYTCQAFTRAFLRHLFINREPSYMRLATLHNLTYYLGLMAELRASIAEGRPLQTPPVNNNA